MCYASHIGDTPEWLIARWMRGNIRAEKACGFLVVIPI
jgi:hypothetical protein